MIVISDRGRQVLLAQPNKIDLRLLEQFPKLTVQVAPSNVIGNELIQSVVSSSPEEVLDRAHAEISQELADELIETIKQCSPEFFERLVVKLLLNMGYGGSQIEAGKAVGKSGDGGIDGVINEDRLGLDAIYIQAKRWEGSVGEGPIRDFKGALDAKGASKGVFITTSTFTPAAQAAAKNSRSYRIVLIDGVRLAQLMIEHDLGVSIAATYQLKKIDSDFFADE
jgi:restriction system protein